MQLSSDDLPMFFDDAHRALAERLKTAAAAIAAAEQAPDEPARDRAAVRALADAGLFELVVPAQPASAGSLHSGPAQPASAGSLHSGPAQPASAGSLHSGPAQPASAGSLHSGPAQPASAGSLHSGPAQPASAGSLHSGPAQPASAGSLHFGPETGAVNARAICLAREMLGYVSPRADSIFAVQGLGTHALLLAGSAGHRADLPAYARGERIAAFALTEPEAGSDVAAIATRATATADGGYTLDGDKLFISNLGIADHATVIATVDPALGHAGLTAFWVPLDAAGVTVEPLTAIAPHPIGALHLRGVRVAAGARIGDVGQGMKLAMQTLDAFRVSVGAAAVGMARRALDEAARFVAGRSQFGKRLADQPLVQAHLADMIVDLDAARLLVLRAAHRRDTGGVPATIEVSIAKLAATEAAQRVIDRAVQLFGGRGVMAGAVVEQLYRAIRPLRIYEGTSEIQRTIIGRAIGKAART